MFLNQLEEFFYIAHQEAADIVQCDKLRNTKQKEDDLKFLDALKDEKCYDDVIEQSTQVILEDSGEDEDLNYSDEDLNYSDEDFLPLKKPKKELFVKSPTNPLKAKKVCQMADRLNLSLNQATGITAAILKSSGVDLDTVTISKTSCHQYCQENRAIMDDEIKSSFVAPELERKSNGGFSQEMAR